MVTDKRSRTIYPWPVPRSGKLRTRRDLSPQLDLGVPPGVDDWRSPLDGVLCQEFADDQARAAYFRQDLAERPRAGFSYTNYEEFPVPARYEHLGWSGSILSRLVAEGPFVCASSLLWPL